MGQRATEGERLAAEHPYLDYVGRDSFYGFLAIQRERLFRDEDFAALYCLDNGRPSVPPSLLAAALLLQTHDGVSDEEAKARADFDCAGRSRWGSASTRAPSPRAPCSCFVRSSSSMSRSSPSSDGAWPSRARSAT